MSQSFVFSVRFPIILSFHRDKKRLGQSQVGILFSSTRSSQARRGCTGLQNTIQSPRKASSNFRLIAV
jgi:hypothetical protein